MTKTLGETSFKETAFGILPRSKIIPLEIEGLDKAWQFTLVTRSKGNIPITPEFLKKVHNVGFGWIFPDFGGKYRTVEVSVSDHIPPECYLVPEHVENLCQDISTRLKHLPNQSNSNFLIELTNLLAWAHHRFLWIHPFVDYNGRIARLLNNIILLNIDHPPIELKVETKSGRKMYIQALQAYDQGKSSKLEKIISASIEEATSDLLRLEGK